MTNPEPSGLIMVPVSAGELLDKISILRIKRAHVDDPGRLANVSRELTLLEDIERRHLQGRGDYGALYENLEKVNAALWDIEDQKRDCERLKTFDAGFIALARQVYIRNDERAAIKRQINVLLASAIVEEKLYREYQPSSEPDRC